MDDDHREDHHRHHHHNEGMPKALFDAESSIDGLEEGSRRNNLEGNRHAEETEQLLALIVQDFLAALLGNEVEATAATQEQPQPQQCSFYGNYAPPQVPSFQEAIAAAQSMPQQEEELGQGWLYENHVPPHVPPVTRSLHQPLIQFQEPAASHALQAQEAIVAATQGMPELPHEGGLDSYYGIHNSVPHYIPPFPSFPYSNQLQEPAAREAIEAQGMPELPQQLGLGSFPGIDNYGPYDLPQFQRFQHPILIQETAAASHALQPQQSQQATGAAQDMDELGLRSFHRIGNYAPHDLPPFRIFPLSIQIQEPAASYALHDQQATASAQEMPELGVEPFHGIGNYAPHDLPQLPSFPRPIQAEEPAASHALQAQPAIAAQERGSYYGIDNYVPPNLPPVPSILPLIQICSRPFEKQLSKSDLKQALTVKECDAKRHVLPMLNPNEDPKQGIQLRVYDIDGNNYRMKFKTSRNGFTHFINGTGWKDFVRHYGLKAQSDFVTLWVLRNAQTGNLCLVVSPRRTSVSKTLANFKRNRQI